ncbi:hypothetical protein C1A50_2690 [Paenibacillus polymyxa]|nr:hypothetical protein C1A50_2690 [Paenibacillus polymyxa]
MLSSFVFIFKILIVSIFHLNGHERQLMGNYDLYQLNTS